MTFPPPAAPPVTLTLTPAQVPALAAGATLLGSGGGGEAITGSLLLRLALAERPLAVTPASALPPETLVVHVGLAGAPDVIAERLIDPDDFARAVHRVAAAVGGDAGAVGVIEVGGLNAVVAATAAARLGLPLVDGDLMGRAFPRIDQTVATLHGLPLPPLALVGPGGDTVVIPVCSARLFEPLLRANVLALGAAAAFAGYATSARHLAGIGVPGSVSSCLRLGRRFRSAVEAPGATAGELAAALDADLLAVGRVDEIVPRQDLSPGWATLTDRRTGAVVRIDLLDEYLAVAVDGVTRAETPEIIAAVDLSGGRAVRADQIRPGDHLVLLRLPALYDWPAEAASLVGPSAFGLDLRPGPRNTTPFGRGAPRPGPPGGGVR
ncbi:DUF917 family protein [Streptomyces sp. NPDC019224]|uniref:S-methyl thiohydantoin desulfurase domain-containing protein n=1 Tax=Streptomyces sp. NPDC019224 TaxID=3154484 RepID=UPI0033DE3226